MAVEITFKSDGATGLVGEGTTLWHAAKRMGSPMKAECGGRGECDTCAVAIESGRELLSPITDAERKFLAQRLNEGLRLACQTRVERSGVVVVTEVPRAEAEAAPKRLRDLPFNQQVSTVIELQAMAVSEALNSVRGISRAVTGRLLSLLPDGTVPGKDPAAGGAAKSSAAKSSAEAKTPSDEEKK